MTPTLEVSGSVRGRDLERAAPKACPQRSRLLGGLVHCLSMFKQTTKLAERFQAALPNILERLADGSTLEAACKAHKLTRQSFRDYITANPEAGLAYDRAREAQTEALIDQLQATINDMKMDPRIQANRIKALTWLIEKRDPARYGQRATMDVNIKLPDLSRALEDSDRREQELLARRAALMLPAVVRPSDETVWAELINDNKPA